MMLDVGVFVLDSGEVRSLWMLVRMFRGSYVRACVRGVRRLYNVYSFCDSSCGSIAMRNAMRSGCHRTVC
jgi:hypothetical protein